MFQGKKIKKKAMYLAGTTKMSSKKRNLDRTSTAAKPSPIHPDVGISATFDIRTGRLESIKARVLAGEYNTQSTLIAQSMWSHVKNWLQKSNN